MSKTALLKIDYTKDSIYNEVDSVADFPGGEDSLVAFTNKHLRIPKEAKINHIEGNIFVSFVVRKDSQLTNLSVLRPLCKSCDAEAIRVVKKMPKWIPAFYQGQQVSSKVTIPITINIQD